MIIYEENKIFVLVILKKMNFLFKKLSIYPGQVA